MSQQDAWDALERAADVLESECNAIVARWVKRVRATVYRERPDLDLDRWSNAGAQLIMSMAEALRTGQVEEPDAAWTAAVRADARSCRRLGVPPADMVREYQMLRQEMWRALYRRLVGGPAADFCDIPEHLDIALDTMVGIAYDIYWAEAGEVHGSEQGVGQGALQHYDLLACYTLDSILFIRPDDGRILEANEAAIKAYGYTREELLSLTIDDLRAPEEATHAAERLAKAERFGVFYQTLHRRKDGSTFPVEVSACGVAMGRERVLVSIIRDVTERKRAEEALKESEEGLRLVLAHSPDVMFRQDRDLRYTWVMNAPPPFTEEQILGKTERDIFGREEALCLAEHKRRVIETGRGEAFEVSLTIAGAEHCYLESVEPARDSEGRVVGIYGYVRDITARKRAEDALRQGEERLRLAQTSAHIGVWEWNVRTNEDVFSPELNELFGLPPGTVTTYEGWRQRVHPEDIARVEAERDDALANRRSFDLEYRILHGSGEVRWLFAKGGAVYDEAGEIVRVFGVNGDITERKRVEEALRASQGSLAEAQRLAHLGNYAFEVPAGEVRWSRETFRILGMDPSQGEPTIEEYMQLVHPDDRALVRQAVEQASSERKPFDIEYRVILRGGETRYIRSVGGPVVNDAGPVTKIFGTILDITDRRRGEAVRERLLAQIAKANAQLLTSSVQAQRQAGELGTIIESIADAVFVSDAQGMITLINRTGLALIGRERMETPLTLDEYVATLQLRFPDGRAVTLEELAITRALRGERVRGLEEAATHPITGRRIDLLVSAAPLRDESGEITGAVWVASDITRLKEADRLKDQFVNVALHEVKTPLTILKGYAQFLQRDPAAFPPRYRAALAAIDRQTGRIAHVVQDLLDVSRARAGLVELHLEPVDLPALTNEVVERMQANAPKHHLILRQPGPLVVRGDRERLDQVLVNLLDNAIRYSPRGGDIIVDLRRDDGRAVVSVTDQGVGISREKQAHIFERFYRAHVGTPYDYGSMGIGLYISREIIRRHDGDMRFTSEEGRGSTFSFSLPLGG